MAHCRLEKIGTIYSRITGLIRSGAMKLDDRPMWYEIYEAFPPLEPPMYDRPVPNEPIKQIFYPEDVIRARFYKNMFNSPMGRLDDHSRPTLSQRCIQTTMEVSNEKGITAEDAFGEALEKIKIKMDKTYTDSSPQTQSAKPVSTNVVKDIFKDP